MIIERNDKELKVSVLDGKYEFIWNFKSPDIRCERRGEPWVVFEKGSAAILGLMSEIEELIVKERFPK